jgi:hypothetical protein
MKAELFQAFVNDKEQWRVYYNQELIATFEQEQWAQDFLKVLIQEFVNYLNETYGEL